MEVRLEGCDEDWHVPHDDNLIAFELMHVNTICVLLLASQVVGMRAFDTIDFVRRLPQISTWNPVEESYLHAVGSRTLPLVPSRTASEKL